MGGGGLDVWEEWGGIDQWCGVEEWVISNLFEQKGYEMNNGCGVSYSWSLLI